MWVRQGSASGSQDVRGVRALQQRAVGAELGRVNASVIRSMSHRLVCTGRPVTPRSLRVASLEACRLSVTTSHPFWSPP